MDPASLRIFKTISSNSKVLVLLIKYFQPNFASFILFPQSFPVICFFVSIAFFRNHPNFSCTFLDIYCIYRSLIFFYPHPDCYVVHLCDYLTLLSFILLHYHFDLLPLSLIHTIYLHLHQIIFNYIFFAETFIVHVIFYLHLFYDNYLFFDRDGLFLNR